MTCDNIAPLEKYIKQGNNNAVQKFSPSSPAFSAPSSHLRASPFDSLRVLLDGRRGSPVRIAFSQHGIDGAAEHFSVTSVNLLFLLRLRIGIVVGHVVA